MARVHGLRDEEALVADAHEKLKQIKASGIDTIVDMTAPGLGRQVKRVARAVEGTGLNVIVVTGYYTYTDLPFPMKYNGPGRLFNTDPDDAFLVDLFVGDIEEGIEGTGIKAGVVKCCTDEPGVTPDIERLIRAVAKTHLRTDVPIMTHTHAKSRRGLDQQRILREEGVDLSRVLIGHSNETSDLDYLIEMMEAGSYLGFDRCGLMVDHPLDDQQETLVELCKRGYAGQIVLSQDRHCSSDWFPEDGVVAMLPRLAPRVRPAVADPRPAGERRHGGAGRPDDAPEPPAVLRGAHGRAGRGRRDDDRGGRRVIAGIARPASVADLRALQGTELGPTDWAAIGQETIDAFAQVTGDHQWIHVDPERAAASPMGGTIAHGL